ncbi:unnamed protein product [Pylaiella littoralis]
MVEQGGHPAAVLRVFSEMLPNKRHVSRETTFRDRGKLRDINKLHSASTAVSGAAHGYPGPSHLAAHHAARVAASSTAPQPRSRGSSVRGGGGRYSSAGTSVPLPFTPSVLPPTATARRPAHQGGSARGNGRGASAPPPPPSNAAAADRKRYTDKLRENQQAMTSSPNADRCHNCADKGRVDLHHHKACAFSLCRRCKRGGHRAVDCTFPPYRG